MKAVAIWWGDAHGCTGWLNRQQSDSLHKGASCLSVGLELKRDRHGISLITNNTGDMHGVHGVGQLMFIPKGVIRHRIVLHPGLIAARVPK